VYRSIRTCLNKTSVAVRASKRWCGGSPVHTGPNEGNALSPLLFNFAVELKGLTLTLVYADVLFGDNKLPYYELSN
jgi:hypothetical protein